MNIQVILASTRPGRVGERVARWVTTAAEQQPGFNAELVDLADYDLPHFDEPISPRFNPDRQPNQAARRWLTKVARADGYVIVTPEYNHSVPGILKDALDYLDWQFAKKPVAIVSYGTVGGARAAQQLKQMLVEVKAAVVPEAVAFIGAGEILNESGLLNAAAVTGRSPQEALATTLRELAWWTDALKAARAETAKVA
ncbi:MAG TPA: NAD(P)H-dependent oxidoreductase [Candidatus Saccharimonadia bacterium]|jgi:NAD(P)H-dependent FMN reductase